MKRYLTLGVISFMLMGLGGCAKPASEIPELLEPVAVKVDMAEVTVGDVTEQKMYSGEVVPYVEDISFAADGNLEQMMVMVGDTVKQGEVLAVLNTDQLVKQMELLEEDIQYTEKTGQFSDRKMELDIEIARTELLALQENQADAQTCAEKELEIQKLELQLKQTAELRELELEKKQEELQLLQEKEEKNQLTAPFDGTVVYISDVKHGDLIQAYEPVIYIADDTKLSLAADYIPEYDLMYTARIYAKILDKDYELSYLPYNDEEYISMILNDVEPKAKFAFEAPDDMLKSGLYAAIIVVKKQREDVLTVPVNALYQDGIDWYVYRQENGERVRCDVVTGLISETNAEITEGLKEGDLVYVKD